MMLARVLSDECELVLFSSKLNRLSRAEVAPLGESGAAVKLEIGT